MPLYETVMQEKPPVVLDIGTAYTKLGFAAEAHPRKIIYSASEKSNGDKIFVFDYENSADLYDRLVEFLQTIFFKHLLVSPKERKMIVVENVFGPTVFRETLARVLFRHYEVSSVLFVPSHMISLSTLAVPTALVIDIGYSETTILPVFSGVQIMKAFQDQSYGGRAVHAEIKRQLLETGVESSALTESLLEDIKVRACFVTSFERANMYRNQNNKPIPPPETEFPTSNEHIIVVPGETRETAFEVLFAENNDRDSLPHLILKSILSCPVDTRQELIKNIFVIGGGSMAKGLLSRLLSELKNLVLNDNEYKLKFNANTIFKFHNSICCRNYCSWLGASLCGGTDLIHSRSLTKEVFVKFDRVPDWVYFNDNRVIGSDIVR